ncbi:hypothetical protein L1987_50325 [Smallanthus sonchifolius]|uniref:Uncharacterized protein n=1 Tax=Smallanthus sonchifolius TaxID=185202 RepID=A0ACB9ELM2_9ASTR|nr:hypothetical protein L1987_50325 [Smallanthus sonchifolius]
MNVKLRPISMKDADKLFKAQSSNNAASNDFLPNVKNTSTGGTNSSLRIEISTNFNSSLHRFVISNRFICITSRALCMLNTNLLP